MAKKLGTRTVTVVRKPKVDRLAAPAAGAATEHDIEDCSVLPRTSFEQDKGWVVVEGRQVFAPYDADVLADDKIRLDDGTVWNVDGEPGRYENKRGRAKACIFYLKRLGT